MILKDIPAWAESFINAARMIALASAGKKSDAEVRPDVERIIGMVEADMIEAVGADKAAIILDGFRGAVYGHKAAVEKAAASGSLSEFLEVVSL
jgi:hypothetical protein